MRDLAARGPSSLSKGAKCDVQPLRVIRLLSGTPPRNNENRETVQSFCCAWAYSFPVSENPAHDIWNQCITENTYTPTPGQPEANIQQYLFP